MSDVPDQSASSGTGTPSVDFVALSAGRTIGRYEIVSVLGQGGFGITYRAHDSQLHRAVAIKEYLPLALAVRQDGTTVLPRSTDAAADFAWGRDRFVAEGRTLASLQNAPAIVRVFDFLEANGTAYIVMQLLSGETLEHRLKQKGPLAPAEVDRILWPLLDGLDQVHAAGFLHRDIKPANILLDDVGNPTLIDFGASRAAMAGRTAALTAIFTPGYAAAEQFTSAKQGPWTDIYGLSATLYHAVTGQTPPSAFDRMLDDSYQPLGGKALPGFSPGLLVGIDAGLALRAADRPQSIGGWRLVLGQTTAPDAHATVAMARQGDGATVRAPATSVATPVAPSVQAPAKSRLPLFAGIAAVALALAGGGGYLAFAPGSTPVPTATVLQDLKIEDLERVLAERRKADAAAAEKKRLEEEAQRRAEADAAAKKAADAELEKAQQARLKAEQELAQMKADMEARRQAEAGQREQTDAVARRAAEEAAQRKAEAEMAALRQAEDDARKKAAVEADAKRQADEALVRAQAERQKAESEAKQKAEAEVRQKAESSAREVAEAEARQKAEADARQKADAAAAAAAEKKAAEADETALRFAMVDRQRLQVALTSLGFDTRGSDGAFGPRSREMIANWQRGHSYPATGFLTGAQNQALLREAAPAVAKFDDEQRKLEEAKKKADEEKARSEAAAKAVPPPVAAAPPPAAAAPNVAAAAPRSGPDGLWRGTMQCTPSRVGAEFSVGLQVNISGGAGTWTRPGSGPGTRGIQSVSLQISGAQVQVSRVFVPNNPSGVAQTGRMSARYEGNSISGAGPEQGGGGRTCNISLTRGP
ncbi:MAG: protein kinase [Rhodospirillales bacterium]|nr:protein kinase [Rhodospirillales bacterium]